MDKIHHIAIEVKNIQDSIDWYTSNTKVKFRIKIYLGFIELR